jgi:uncharacterized protein
MQKQEIIIPGPVGAIEAVLQLPDQPDNSMFGIVCHPNPLQEGTMHNKVVTTVARAFNALNIPCIRFNYRGVGKSAGSFGNIAGEVDDAVAVAKWVQDQWPDTKFCLAGFSFGAYIAASLASIVPTVFLLSIAPAVDRIPYADLAHVACPWLVIQGENDEVVGPEAVYTWFAALNANKTLVKFAETGHFFHGKLLDLQQQIQQNFQMIK